MNIIYALHEAVEPINVQVPLTGYDNTSANLDYSSKGLSPISISVVAVITQPRDQRWSALSVRDLVRKLVAPEIV